MHTSVTLVLSITFDYTLKIVNGGRSEVGGSASRGAIT
jgi:hypothetical protein